ncbi:SRPBCC family protein [Streptomyces sp. YS415]|uniref:SRPBCC family protein n=1 Tax=Streptomyces sp. YS415 TaxID=2944806 RepID=UPI002021A125|nr:SRPBCC family protein [Streptomyces sp. YS415]MCL7428319.1 SRPBCC family protein [Streptomyces sp. YS415]
MSENPGPVSSLAHSEAGERLKAEIQEYLAAQAQRLLVGAGQKLGETTGKLNDIAEGNSPGFAKLALDGGRKLAEGKGPMRSALELGASRAKDSIKDKLRNLGGGKGKGKGAAGKKPTVIMEYIDVGVPLRKAYDQWTKYQEFGSFAKGVQSADRSDDTTSDWKMKIFWSSRSWKAKTAEQVPDQRIVWNSEGAKGTTKGVVTFHQLAENLTRVLLVIEYYPKGLFEKTGNIWRAQGRRARLDLKHYARFVSFKDEVEDGWRGEIQEGEVVVSHDDAIAEEEQEQEQEQDQDQDESQDAYEEDEADDEATDEVQDEPEDEPDEAEDAYEDEEAAEDEAAEDDVPEDEAAEADEEEYEDEPEEAHAGSGDRR